MESHIPIYTWHYLSTNCWRLWPAPECKLAITHVGQLPCLGLQLSVHAFILLISNCAGNKHRCHEVIIGGVSVSVERVFHEPGHCTTQLRSRVLGHNILESLTKLQSPVFRRHLLSEVVRVSQHGAPMVSIEVMNGATRANDEIAFLA